MKNIILPLIFSFLLISILMVQPAQATMLVVSTPTKTPTRTPTPRFNVTLTKTPLPSLLSLLPSQLEFGFGGGGGEFFDVACIQARDKYRGVLPAVLPIDRGYLTPALYGVCIVGLAVKDSIQVTLTDIKVNKKIGDALISIDEVGLVWTYLDLDQVQPVFIDDIGGIILGSGKVSVTFFSLWIPPDVSGGTLKIDIKAGDSQVSGSLVTAWTGNESFLYIPSNKLSPFHEPKTRLKIGETQLFQGINYPKNADLAVAVYNKSTGRLHYSGIVRSDSLGRLNIQFKFGASDQPAIYAVGVFSNPNNVSSKRLSEYVDLDADTCPGAPRSFLGIGERAKLNPEVPRSNNIRSQAGLKNSLVGELKANQTAIILDGMKCC